MTPSQLRVIIMAVRIRMGRGESIDAILDSYTNLTREEKELIRNNVEHVVKE